jgi:hypothetical protein
LSVAGLANAQDTGEPVKIFTEQLTSHAAISAAAISISADAFVDGHIASQAAATTGARSEVQNIVSGAATGIGAAAKTCNIYAGAAIAVGAGSTVGALSAGGAVTLGALTIRDEICDSAPAVVTSNFDAANAQIKSAQSALDTIPASSLVDAYTLVGSMDTGVYEGAAITIPASTVITFDANGQDGIWIFNLSGAMTVGAGSEFEIINAGDNNAVIWNIGGALTLGAGSTFLGTAFVEGAVSGATASVSCGNLYATGAISIGSIGSIGGDDCKVAADQLADFAIEDGVSSFDQVGVVNIDFQTGGTAYVGLGVLGSDSDTMWNSVGPLGSGGTNLLFADGSGPSGISVTTTHGNGYANTLQPNPLHVDWVYSWSQQETIIISGLTPNTTFDISFYDGFYWQDFTVQGQPELVAQIRPTAEQCGSPSTANSCNGIISGVFSDGSGQITIIGNALPGGWPGQDASTIAGMQILQSN